MLIKLLNFQKGGAAFGFIDNLTDGLITGETEGAPTWSSMDLKQLEVGDYCINNLNKKIKIVSLEETNEYVGMYNLEHLSNNKNWFANGILVKE